MPDRRDADFLREKWQFLRVGFPMPGGRKFLCCSAAAPEPEAADHA